MTAAGTMRTLKLLPWFAALGLVVSAEQAAAQASCPIDPSTADVISHDMSVSFCELCDVGEVRIVVENPFGPGAGVGEFANLEVTEDLRASGLSYVPGSTVFSVDNLPGGSTPPVVEPSVNGSELTWTIDPGFSLPAQPGGGNRARLIIEFEVQRDPNPEGLVSANRDIQASVTFDPECGEGASATSSTPVEELPLLEPEPVITKGGRNADAGQNQGNFQSTVFGHRHDRIVWRIRVQNNGAAPLEDVVFSDQIQPGFEFTHICPSNPSNGAVTSGSLGGCRALAPGTTTLSDLVLADELGVSGSIVPPGGNRDIFLVGKVTDSCIFNAENRVSDIEWGCQSEAPPGGISQTSTGLSPVDATAFFHSEPNNPVDGLVRTVELVGANTDGQPMGSKGTVVIRITNTTGGTVRNISFRDILPAEYVIDSTSTPTVTRVPRGGFSATYAGMIDEITWTNPAPGTFPLTSTDPADPLANTNLTFELTSSTQQDVSWDVTDPDPDPLRYQNMLRQGDTLEIRFRTILIDPQYYDKVAHPDVRAEAPNSDPPGTDPTATFPIQNVLEITSYEELCTTAEHGRTPFTTNDTAEPEDIDVDIAGSQQVLVVNSLDPTPLTVELSNNGGHDAEDYFAYVSFGEAMDFVTVPGDCSVTTNPPTIRGDDAPVWRLPETIPASASVYACDVDLIPPNATRALTFEVIKNQDPSADDDLTFRADVIGEITLSNGDALWFPAPTQRLPEDGLQDLANNYTLDAVRARVIGFELTKEQLGICTENNPPPDPNNDANVQIGEECSARIYSGDWFGFLTPGFTPIAVWDVELVDELPDGQGYISQTEPVITPQILNVQLTPPPAPIALAEDWFGWTFNTAGEPEWITERSHSFEVDVTTRLLNDPTQLANPIVTGDPNRHAALSRNIANAIFRAVFTNELTGAEEEYTVTDDNVGYPREPRRRVDLTVTEPLLILEKEVCNETLYGAGEGCTNFVDLTDEGDAFDSYVYRITVTNEASADGVTRAPAYDVTVTSTTDPGDWLFVDPLTGDTLDNDGDGLVDGGDDEGVIVPDNTTQNGTPAQVIASYTHSDALLRIDPGQSVVLYYRVDPDDDVAPQQLLTGEVFAEYDSLEDEFGNQSDPQRPNGDVGGAREYRSETAEATIQIIPVEVDPKQVLRVSNSGLVASGNPQPVSIGEEVEFQLRTLIPVAQLRNFVVRDELPEGLSCAEAPVVNLSAPPYDAAGFVPGGTFTPTCTDVEVVWDFGNQTVSFPSPGLNRYDFRIEFISRVDNIQPSQDGVVITNGGDATETTVSYVNEQDELVVIEFEEAEVVVREPEIELTKTFEPAEADAGDVLTVTVTATNTGSATAYNLRLLDDLSAGKLNYAGQVSGADPPSDDVTTFGEDRPLFTWPTGFAIAPDETIEFSFAVEVDGTAEPHEILPNTIQADWTSLPSRDTALNTGGEIGPDGSATGMRNGALPNAGDSLNDYETEASDEVVMRAPTMTKEDLEPALAPEIGVHKPFRIEIVLPEGTTTGLTAVDDLDSGAASYVLANNGEFDITYEFVGITSINGEAPGEAAFAAIPPDGATDLATWDIGTVVTDTEDDLDTQSLSPTIRIDYFARINNDLVTDRGDALQNSATVSYINAETGSPETLNASAGPIVAIESDLFALKALSNVTPGKEPDDPLELDDILEYVVTVDNNGDATAYDVNIVDTLPLELALHDGFTPTAAINGAAVSGFIGVPAGAPDGPLVWGRENGDGSIDIPPGGFLELTYQVTLRAPADEGVGLTNSVMIDWTSLGGDSVHERTGEGCPAWTAPDDYCFGPAEAEGETVPVPPPDALLKANTQATAGIGEEFSYRITVPSSPHTVALYDVRILDDLAASAADLAFVSVAKVSGSGDWTPVNTGAATDLVIEDPANGIDIPAGEQAVIEITVVLEDTATNVAGLTFTNTAAYTFNRLNGNEASERSGDPGTSEPMTIVEPDLTLEKSGPAQMRIGSAGTFTLDVHNVSDGRAWGLTVTDRLPDTDEGGMCDAAPSAITAQMAEADGTAVGPALTEGTDFALSFSGDPDCEFSIETLSAAAAIGADQRLIVTYEALLDVDSEQDASLTNLAGATEWFSADVSDPDTADRARSYTRTLTDGTVGVLDHEDAHTVTVNLPLLLFEKTVANVSRGEAPATLATPGETLRYSLRIENLSDVEVSEFSIVDELDRLNDSPAFQAGTLDLVTVPADADTSGTDPSGGADGTGLLDIRDLALGGEGDSVLIEFEIALAPVIANDSVVRNQSELMTGGVAIEQSDDPNINGPADPLVPGDEDPTEIRIESAPEFRVEKVSTYIDGDPNVLLAGETLRYTITVTNIGTDHASDAMLRDQIPANTAYVPGSTTLNGDAVPDAPSGLSALTDGILLHAPEDSTPGTMRADASQSGGNVATIVFDVAVNADVIDGTVISNQGFVSALEGGVVEQPSDDPRTPAVDDPTRDVVGNLPLLFAEKSAELLVDEGSPNIVDPGDVLRYTIAIHNNGAIDATNAVLSDDVPENTTYVADSLTLNGLSVGGSTSPLVAGIPVSSADLTPPLPGAGEGTLTRGETAVIQFDLRVDDGVPAGTLISNQAVVRTGELPNLLTDGDGNPSTGPEPTVVVVGDGQQLAITKQVAVVGGGAAIAGATLEYVVRVVNIAAVPAFDVVIRDDLDMPNPGYLAYVDGSATMNGSAAGVSFAGSLLTADYSAANGELPPGGSIVLRFRAMINPDLEIGTTVTNTAVVYWNDPQQTASASVSIDVGGIPGIGILNGSAWHDADFDNALDSSERELEGWTVELYRNDRLVHSTSTDASGVYRINGLAPNYLTGDQYELRFVAPGAGSNTALLGSADSAFTDGLQRISDLVVQSGSNLQDLNLPIDPNGVVYDSVVRTPIPGATLTLLHAASGAPVATACLDDPGQQDQVTLADGYYKFDINFSEPSCPSGGSYIILMTAPGAGYVPGYSEIIPPASGESTAPFSVPACRGSAEDAVPATAEHCETQTSEFAPPVSVRARTAGTAYHAHLTLDSAQVPGSSQIFNNHIPLDPELEGSVAITKTTPLVNVTRGQLVPYVITVSNSIAINLQDVAIVDRFPAGFRYVEGSASIDGAEAEPEVIGRELVWNDLELTGNGRHTLMLLLAVGAGVSEGEYVNRAQAIQGLTLNPLSGEASATVRLVPDPTFDCTDVIGKVFDDENRNGVQDEGERGLPGARLATARGLTVTTDEYGRFHITCAVVPNESRGSNFILKLDDRTLPSGYRPSTDAVRVQRATRGKALRFNFGASIHRVVGLDIADPVFEPDSTEMRPQWQPRIGLLLEELRKGPSVLRLSYLADTEDLKLVEQRVDAIKKEIIDGWTDLDCCYDLVIEPEVFWRRGGPPDRPAEQRRKSR